MKYVTVRDYLVELIDTGLSVGDVVPSERELAERFGVSRMTVRQAVDSLVSSGRQPQTWLSGWGLSLVNPSTSSIGCGWPTEFRWQSKEPGSPRE